MGRAVVVGAGISGLVAARALAAAGHDVLVLEGTDRVGGKLRRGEVAGLAVDVGAEAMVSRRPEGVRLAGELALPVTHPTDATSRIWTRGALRPLPRTLMGAPLDLDELAASGVLSPEGLARARREPELPASGHDDDVSVGALVDERFGTEVTDRLVEPLLGGVYAGHAREISARAAIPQLLTMAARGSVVAQGAGLPRPGSASAPVFAGVPGGMWQLPERLTEDLAATGRVELRTGTVVRRLERAAAGWDVDGERAEAVVLATPAPATARLLADVAPGAAAELVSVDYASTALVTFAFPAADAAEALDVGASGFLVPPMDHRRVKAATFSFAKWEWVRAAGAADDLLVLRTSLGRHGEAETLQVPDEDLVAASLAELAEATGLRVTPVDTVVQRWGGGLPQYAVGHVDRVDRIRAHLDQVPGLEVCGAAYDGVGIAACVASGERAARLVAGGFKARR